MVFTYGYHEMSAYYWFIYTFIKTASICILILCTSFEWIILMKRIPPNSNKILFMARKQRIIMQKAMHLVHYVCISLYPQHAVFQPFSSSQQSDPPLPAAAHFPYTPTTYYAALPVHSVGLAPADEGHPKQIRKCPE